MDEVLRETSPSVADERGSSCDLDPVYNLRVPIREFRENESAWDAGQPQTRISGRGSVQLEFRSVAPGVDRGKEDDGTGLVDRRDSEGSCLEKTRGRASEEGQPHPG